MGGYTEVLSLNHLSAYNFLDGMQSGLTTGGIVSTVLGLQSLSTAGASLLGISCTVQGLAWANIETAYMNSGNLNGITIERTVMNGSSMPTPYVSYIIKDSNGNIIGTASQPGW